MFVLKWSQKLLLYTCILRPPLRPITTIFHIMTGRIRGNSPMPANGICTYIKFAELVFQDYLKTLSNGFKERWLFKNELKGIAAQWTTLDNVLVYAVYLSENVIDWYIFP